MEDSIQFIGASPEVIVISDDLYDYEDRDGDIEVLEINKIAIAKEEYRLKSESTPSTSASASTTKVGEASKRKRPARSSLTGRRVYSPTDQVIAVGNSHDQDETLPLEKLDEEKAAEKIEDEEDDLSVIEIFPTPSPADPEARKPFPGPNRFAPNPVFRPQPRTRSVTRNNAGPGASTSVAAAVTGANATPLSAKKIKLSLSVAASSAKNKKLSKSASKRKNLREKLQRRRLQLSGVGVPSPRMKNNRRNKETSIQQSLRSLSNNSNHTTTASVSTSSGNSSAATGTPTKKGVPGARGRKSLKRLRNDDHFVPRGISANANKRGRSPRRVAGARGGRGGGGGGARGRGGRSQNRGDKSNQENIVSSTNASAEVPSRSLQTSWDYRSADYDERLYQHQYQQPDSSSACNSNLPVPRNLDFLPALPFSDTHGMRDYGQARSRGRGRRSVGSRLGAGPIPGLGPTGYGFDAGVPRNFELAPARFSPPPPVTYNVDTMFSNTFVGATAATSSVSILNSNPGPSTSTSVSVYNPMAMLSQAKGAQNSSTESSDTNSDPPKLALSAFGGNLFAPTSTKQRPGTLRPIVIDGSNVAMGHGNNKVFSCRGIRVCVDYFKARGHQTIIAFVPHFKGRRSQTVDKEVLEQLEAEGIVKITPGRTVDGIKISAYDDRFIVQCAAQIGGIVISNDNFRDLFEKEPSWRETIHRRVLQYVWISPDMIMFPDDPLGRGGPRLNDILQF